MASGIVNFWDSLKGKDPQMDAPPSPSSSPSLDLMGQLQSKLREKFFDPSLDQDGREKLLEVAKKIGWDQKTNNFLANAPLQLDKFTTPDRQVVDEIDQTMVQPIKSLAQGLATHPFDTAANAFNGALSSQYDQGDKAVDSWKNGNKTEAVGHGLAAFLPILGPMAARAGENFGQGNFGAGVVDTINLRGMIDGPKINEALAERGIGGIGKAIYDVGFPSLNKELSPASQASIRDWALGQKIVGRYGDAINPTLDLINAHIDSMIKEVNEAVSKNKDPQFVKDRIQGVMDEIDKRSVTMGQPSQAAPLKKLLLDYIGEQTGVERKNSEFPAFDNPFYGRPGYIGPEKLTDPMAPSIREGDADYMKRALEEDKGIQPSKLLEQARAFNSTVPNKTAMKSLSDIAEMAPGASKFNDLMRRDVGGEVRNLDPSIASKNAQISQLIHLRDSLENLSKARPQVLKNVLTMAGGVGGAVMGDMLGMGGSGAGIPPHLIGAVGGGAIGAALLRAVSKDPTFLMRAGVALKTLAEGPIPGLVGQVPRVAGVGQLQQAGQSNKPPE